MFYFNPLPPLPRRCAVGHRGRIAQGLRAQSLRRVHEEVPQGPVLVRVLIRKEGVKVTAVGMAQKPQLEAAEGCSSKVKRRYGQEASKE